MKASVNFCLTRATFRSASGESCTITASPAHIAKAKKLAYEHTVGQAYAYLKKV